MQPKNASSESKTYSGKLSQSKLICKKCKIGAMVPAVEEGDPEYTDNFVCLNCHHHDTIPTKDLLFSQVFTAICGIGICLYLLVTELAIMFQGIQHDNLKDTLKTSGLIFVSALFLSGFIYILFRAQEGFKHRRLYSRDLQQSRDLNTND